MQVGKLSESGLIMAMQLQTNTLPTLSVMRKGAFPADFNCRLCSCGKEMPFHVISCCRELKLNRMENHNKVCEFLRREGETMKCQVLLERRLRSEDGSMGVLNLIMWRKGLMSQYALREINMATGREKVQKYSKFKKAVTDLLAGVREVECYGFPMGARAK